VGGHDPEVWWVPVRLVPFFGLGPRFHGCQLLHVFTVARSLCLVTVEPSIAWPVDVLPDLMLTLKVTLGHSSSWTTGFGLYIEKYWETNPPIALLKVYLRHRYQQPRAFAAYNRRKRL
jgi:hypothetical protein